MPSKGVSSPEQLGTKLRHYFPLAAPSILFVVLTLPLFSYPFLSDDFNFLDRATRFTFSQLLPDPHVEFYRPLSREAYFAVLAVLGRSNPLLGHLFNLSIAIACILLVASLARRLAGPRAGLLAGLLFASLGPLPFLVGWVSCAQDLLAMLFILIAIQFQLARRTIPALLFTGAALLSKETSFFAVPAIVLSRGILERDWSSARRSAIYYGCLAIGWAALNARVGSMVTRGLVTGTGYVGLDNPRLLANIARESCALVNLPVNAKTWPSELNIVTLVGLSILAVLYVSQRSNRRLQPSRPPAERSRVLVFGAVLGLVPATLTAALTKHWVPYYACFPAIGTSLVLSVAVLSVRARAALPAIAVFLLLGVWARGTEVGAQVTATEQNFNRIAPNLKHISSRLHQLHPSFPDSSRLYITVNIPLEAGIQVHLFGLQAPRVWFWNRTLITDDPGRLHPGSGREYLFSVTPKCEVFEIELPGLNIKSLGARPDYREYQSALRSFAYGLAALGPRSTDRAVDVILRMHEADSLTWAFDRRLAATFLFASGEEREAKGLCRSLPELPKRDAIYAVAAVLGPELRGLRLDDAAFRAFGIPQSDPDSYRSLMRLFSEREQLPQVRRMADGLIRLVPGDVEAVATIEALGHAPQWKSSVPPLER